MLFRSITIDDIFNADISALTRLLQDYKYSSLKIGYHRFNEINESVNNLALSHLPKGQKIGGGGNPYYANILNINKNI